ncbi:FHA domain-containing protein [Chloroflexota bacterium]
MEEPSGAVLVVEKGMAEASVIPLDKRVHILGKAAGADTAVDNPYVSRRHAEVCFVEGRYQVRDLGSKNGTFVNGSAVGSAAQWLNNGDRIELGRDQVVLRFQTSSGTITLPSSEETSPGAILVDARSQKVQVGERLLAPPLSAREFAVLLLMYERKGEACSGNEIASRGWPERDQINVAEREIEQCVRRLRLRLEPDPSQPCHILTVPGRGYKLAQG